MLRHLSVCCVPIQRIVVPPTVTKYKCRKMSQGRPEQKHKGLVEAVRSTIPPLSHEQHKGQCGKICVVGGCQEYTGAPYFAAISALRTGGDLAHVICAPEAAPVIKSYSPELIVHPILNERSIAPEFEKWLPRFHALVIGPGLGRDEPILDNVRIIIEMARERQVPLVIDADGLFLITKEPALIKNYSKATLTPNQVEFVRLYEAVIGSKPKLEDPETCVQHLCRSLGYTTIVKKGHIDVISNGENVVSCISDNSARRCGGQGDLLSGSMGTFIHWAYSATSQKLQHNMLETYGPNICGAYAACLLTRECNRLAFAKHGRSMICTDMISQIHTAFDITFPGTN